MDPQTLSSANYSGIVKATLRRMYPDVKKRREKKQLYSIISPGAAFQLRAMVLDNPDLIGTTQEIWVPADDDIDMLSKGHIDRELPADERRLKDNPRAWYDALGADNRVERRFNRTFFTAGDSREPELSGIRGALMGSALTLLVTLVLSFPIGVGAAVYLEEFAPKNRWTDLIEVNINNLAAVPSIVFGLLGLAVFLNFFELPRSAPVVGGLVLSLMTLPTIIIASRAALKSVPPSIREAALGIGASKMQTVTHHVLPLAMPGMLTGTIIGMAQALGETAPLLMIGMVAFIVDIPTSPLDPATALPVQIFLWADSPERAFVERTSAAIMVLLAFLILMNAAAVLLRKRFERRW
ncbi:MAG: phosphate ABC transporter permease PstA [Pseudomonadota bacterium]